MSLPCVCGEDRCPATGGGFYVSVRRDDGDYRFLAGPYETHAEALALVPRVTTLANELDARSVWYAFGTARALDTYRKPGILQDRLAAR